MGPRGRTNLKLRPLSRAVSRQCDAYVTPTGPKGAQHSPLSHSALLGPIRPSDLSQRLKLDASTLTPKLQARVAQGWVEQGAGEAARSRSITATAAGRAQREAGQRAWKAAQLALNERLGVDRVTAWHALPDDCMAALEAPPDDSAP